MARSLLERVLAPIRMHFYTHYHVSMHGIFKQSVQAQCKGLLTVSLGHRGLRGLRDLRSDAELRLPAMARERNQEKVREMHMIKGFVGVKKCFMRMLWGLYL